MTHVNSEPVKLHAVLTSDQKGRPPLVILHGMLGSSRNWTTMARCLSEHFEVWTVDLRNHGTSPHATAMTYPAMAADLAAFLDREQLEKPVLAGHSMGGKVAMRFAVESPDRISGLVVVDIAPKTYAPRWDHELAILQAIDLGSLNSRAEAEERLKVDIADWAFRKFLLTNLVRDSGNKGFRWAINLDVIRGALPELFLKGIDSEASYHGPTLFLRGERSRFVQDRDLDSIQEHFPKARVETIAKAGHNVHFDQPEAFAEQLLKWSDSLPESVSDPN